MLIKTALCQYNELDEIVVTRKIQVDKGSKYFINQKEVRARDAQTFFADLSTGAHSPSLISQGRIGSLVTSKACRTTGNSRRSRWYLWHPCEERRS